MQDITESQPEDAPMKLCEEAIGLAGQLPQKFAEGQPEEDILDRLAFLLQQLTNRGASNGIHLTEAERALLAQVQNHVLEAEKAAAQWFNGATPQLDQLARSLEMRRAYGSCRAMTRQR